MRDTKGQQKKNQLSALLHLIEFKIRTQDRTDNRYKKHQLIENAKKA